MTTHAKSGCARCAAAVALVLLSAVCAAEPVLQPSVKEYRAEKGTFDARGLAVFHEDQASCAIGAAEIPHAGARTAWTGGELPARGVFIATAESTFGRALAQAFALDVPRDAQGYALAARDGRVAIVGRDGVGALYGAETFRQMADEGAVENAAVRDWPDFRHRVGPSIGRGAWNLGSGEADRLDALKYAVDEMVRHKINLVSDLFWPSAEGGEWSYPIFRALLPYMRARGMRVHLYAGSFVYSRGHHPEGVTLRNWPCVTDHRAWHDSYYCWSDDAATEAAAARYADFLEKIDATDAIVTIHPVDGGGVENPEQWNARCAKCRARWKDDERWAASANQFNIWSRVFRKRLPRVSLGSCVYPYKVSALRTPEAERTPLWRQNVVDYWRKLDGALEDPAFWTSTWIAPPDALAEYRTLVPTRPLAYGDTYPQDAGVFSTCHRKLGSMWEPGAPRAAISGTDKNAKWEACLLAAEYAWNRRAPGAEIYDGAVYYDPRTDHTGPADVITNALVRICRTFWGRELAPHMARALASGVLPEYLARPQGTVKYWNAILGDADHDPLQSAGSGAPVRVPFTPLVDSLELVRSQVAAAEVCAEAIRAARPHAEALDKYKRRYFAYFCQNAPRWAACARARCALREAERLAHAESRAAAAAVLRAARVRCAQDYAAIASDAWAREPSTLRHPEREPWGDGAGWLAALDRACTWAEAAPDDPRVPQADAAPVGGTERSFALRTARTVTWEGEHVVDRPVHVDQKDLFVKPGAKVVFRGAGALLILDGSFVAQGASFEAEGVLTNAYRVNAVNGRLLLEDCAFRNMRCVNPGGRRWFIGAVHASGGRGSCVQGCRFAGCDALAFTNPADALVEGNVFEGASSGLFFLNDVDSRVVRNLFRGAAVFGAGSNSGVNGLYAFNRFENCALGLRLYCAKRMKVAGNAFRGGVSGVCNWAPNESILAGNAFEGVTGWCVDARDKWARGNVIADNRAVNCGHGFGHFARLAPEFGVAVRGNAERTDKTPVK